jgi:hypothetical protein
LQEPVNQGRFAMIEVGDDGFVALLFDAGLGWVGWAGKRKGRGL